MLCFVAMIILHIAQGQWAKYLLCSAFFIIIKERSHMKFFVVALFALLVASCAKQVDEANDSPKENIQFKTEDEPQDITRDNIKIGFVYPGQIKDAGYTQSCDKARLNLLKNGIQNIFYAENVGSTADCEMVLRDLIDIGCSLIFATSPSYESWVRKVARDFPDTKFVVFGSNKIAKNVSSYILKTTQSRYLAGIVAGKKTKSQRIGYIVPDNSPQYVKEIDAFALGAQKIKEVTVIVKYCGENASTEDEENCVKSLAEYGCDVITQTDCTMACQIAANNLSVYYIGNNSPTPLASPKVYLTASTFDCTPGVISEVENFLQKNWESHFYTKGLESGFVDLGSLSLLCVGGTGDIVSNLKEDFASGSFDIFSGPIFDNTGKLQVVAGNILSDNYIEKLDWYVEGVEVSQ